MRKCIAVLASMVFATGAIVVTAAPAAAVGIDVECAGSFNSTFSPPITSSQQWVNSSATNTYSICVTGPSGVGQNSSTDYLSCLSLATATATITETITWSASEGGGSSTVLYTNVTIVDPVTVWTGMVTGGRFEGQPVVKEFTVISGSGTNWQLCFLPPPVGGSGELSGASGLINITIGQDT